MTPKDGLAYPASGGVTQDPIKSINTTEVCLISSTPCGRYVSPFIIEAETIESGEKPGTLYLMRDALSSLAERIPYADIKEREINENRVRSGMDPIRCLNIFDRGSQVSGQEADEERGVGGLVLLGSAPRNGRKSTVEALYGAKRMDDGSLRAMLLGYGLVDMGMSLRDGTLSLEGLPPKYYSVRRKGSDIGDDGEKDVSFVFEPFRGPAASFDLLSDLYIPDIRGHQRAGGSANK